MTLSNLSFEASEGVAAALTRLGRTEDIRISPDQRRMAIAGYVRNACLLIEFQVQRDARGVSITLNQATELSCDDFNFPHGLDFIGDAALVVANREGAAVIVPLPPVGAGQDTVKVAPLRFVRGGWLSRLRSPGSVAVHPLGAGRHEVLICNNYVNCLTRHVVDAGRGYRVKSNAVLLHKHLHIPDGVTVDPSGRWLAISNHENQQIVIFDRNRTLHPGSAPVCVLDGTAYPHGLRFSQDARMLFVADAGAKVVNAYASGPEGWAGKLQPVGAIEVLDEASFALGRINPMDGGTKGIDILHDAQVLVTTSEFQTLGFFDLAAVTAVAGQCAPAA